MKCYYQDAQTGITHYTQASFIKWTTPTGLLHTPCAMFLHKTTILSIPRYLLTSETRVALDALKSEVEEEVAD
jgi:hypothetical protein